MSQPKKRGTANRSVEKAPSSKAIATGRRGRWTAIIIASVVVAIIMIIVGVFYYQQYVAPFRRTILTVDDITINMDYFIKRTRLAGAESFTMLQVLTDEQLIKLEAPRYVGEVTPKDIDQELRRIAGGESETITESEFKEWYRQQLNETELSDSEYRELARTYILRLRLHEYLAERMSTVAEHVHLHAIMLETYEDAEKVRARWEAGEDFADLAREVSLDWESGEKGGDIGWFPRGVLDYGFERVAFDLSTDNVSEILPTPEGYYLLMVSEKADAREIDENFLQVLKGRALEVWLSEEMQFHEIKYNFNSEINAWIEWQLTKR